MTDLLTTKEMAAYLRVQERKIYELVRLERIPCLRVTGKLLFPRAVIERWLLRHTEFAGPALRPAPPVVAGSHDPLLEWALRESGCGLAVLAGGSEDGVRRLAAGEAVVAGMHIIDPASGEYNVPIVRGAYRLADAVLIGWAWREQGLVLAAGNPLGIGGIADLEAKRPRLARRQDGAGAQTLLLHLLQQAGLRLDQLDVVEPPCLTETDLAAAVLDGRVDCGLAIRAVARQFRLAFVPLHRERFDLLLRRRDYFEPPLQKLLRFAGSAAFRERAAALGGYDLAPCGTVVDNA